MTCTYYEVDIIYTSSSDGDKFYNNGEETIPFETVDEVKKWLNQKYGSDHTLFKNPNYKMKRSIMYQGDACTPCGYVFEFEDADWSHNPVEKWIQRDWITINKIVSKNAFKEVKYEIPDDN